MLAQISAIDKVSIVALAKKIEAEEKTSTICELALKLQVPLMSESRNRRELIERVTQERKPPRDDAKVVVSKAIQTIIAFLMLRSGAMRENHNRRSYAPWFKDFIIECHERGESYPKLSELTGIGVDTLIGFQKSTDFGLTKKPLTETAERIMGAWNNAPFRYRESLDSFWHYLGKEHSDLAVSFKEMRQILIELGLKYPRGPKIADHGAQVKKPYSPHAIWEGDGKQMKVRINGRSFIYSWYAFTDQNTTLLVGSDVGRTESAENFLKALKNGGDKSGFYPIGLLIDNRLSDGDLSPIQAFCHEHGIVLCRIFPGNSKTNGNIENNFSIFERFVGTIDISGNNGEEIARSLAKTVIEIFTQLRNHTPRKRLRGESPEDATKGAKRPEEKRTAIEKIAARLDRENNNIDGKWELIAQAREKFAPLLPESETKLKKQLGRYPASDIIAAQARYLAQIAKYPENYYGPEYFLAILRHKRESIAKQTYNEAYRAGMEKQELVLPQGLQSTEQYAVAIVDELLEIMEEPTPAHKMMRLEALCWWLAGYSTRNSITDLWKAIVAMSERTLAISLRWWTTVNEYLCERMGPLLHKSFLPRKDTLLELPEKFADANLVSHNLSSFSPF